MTLHRAPSLTVFGCLDFIACAVAVAALKASQFDGQMPETLRFTAGLPGDVVVRVNHAQQGHRRGEICAAIA